MDATIIEQFAAVRPCPSRPRMLDMRTYVHTYPKSSSLASIKPFYIVVSPLRLSPALSEHQKLDFGSRGKTTIRLPQARKRDNKSTPQNPEHVLFCISKIKTGKKKKQHQHHKERKDILPKPRTKKEMLSNHKTAASVRKQHPRQHTITSYYVDKDYYYYI